MSSEELNLIFNKFVKTQSEVLCSKGNDYSNEDRLSNFKEVGSVTKQTPEMVCLTLIGVKVARLSNLLSSSKKPSNESVNDSILDLANYSFLLNCIITEKNK